MIEWKQGDKATFTNPQGQKFDVVIFIPRCKAPMADCSVVWFGDRPRGDGQSVFTRQLSPARSNHARPHPLQARIRPILGGLSHASR